MTLNKNSVNSSGYKLLFILPLVSYLRLLENIERDYDIFFSFISICIESFAMWYHLIIIIINPVTSVVNDLSIFNDHLEVTAQ